MHLTKIFCKSYLVNCVSKRGSSRKVYGGQRVSSLYFKRGVCHILLLNVYSTLIAIWQTEWEVTITFAFFKVIKFKWFYRITVYATLLIQALEIYSASSDVDETLIEIAFSLYRLCFRIILRSSISAIPIETRSPIVDNWIGIAVSIGFSSIGFSPHFVIALKLCSVYLLYAAYMILM